jgi:signal transduction histidine kinase
MNDFVRADRPPSDAGTDDFSGRNDDQARRWGLLARIGIAVAGLAAALVLVFSLLTLAVVALRHRSLEARHAQQVIATANGLQTLVIDFETGLRGFVITKEESYLEPWRTARVHYPKQVSALIRLTAADPAQQQLARDIKKEIDDYFGAYSPRFMQFLRRNPAAAAYVAAAAQEVTAIRSSFKTFLAREEAEGVARDHRARLTTRHAIYAAVIGLVVALASLATLAFYLARAVARPVRLAAGAAKRIATGDLSSRLPTGGPGEVGELEEAFNAMADSLQRTLEALEERNRRLIESERLKTELVSNVSHELRTPLASVLGFSDLMLKREFDREEQRHYLDVIRTEAARLATLLNDLLDLQRQEQGVIDLHLQQLDLNELLAVQVTLYAAQSNAHEIVFGPSEEPVLVEGDRDRLAQVIGNLLSNAIKYSPDGGRIDVRTAHTKGQAWIWVHDPGLGIPREQQHQIFTKFFRGDGARLRGIPGTGLGLVLSQQTIEAHGGKLGFESEEGRGSTFWIRLPAVDASAAARDDAEASHRA